MTEMKKYIKELAKQILWVSSGKIGNYQELS